MTDWVYAHKRAVTVALILAFILLVIARNAFFPSLNANGEYDFASNLRSILDGLISTIVVTFVVSFALWWMRPPLDRIPPGYEILSSDISRSLETAAQTTDEWEYVGHTGRYVRNRIYNAIRQGSTSRNKPCRIRLVIINPTNLELCLHYSKYRNASRSNDMFQAKWDVEMVQRELITTIIKTILLHIESNNVQCEIALREFLSLYRTDLSNEQVTVTQEDPQEPAFQYPRGSKFFDYARRENRLIWDQSTKLNIDNCDSVNCGSSSAITQYLVDLYPDFQEMTQMIEEAYELISDDRSPYA